MIDFNEAAESIHGLERVLQKMLERMLSSMRTLLTSPPPHIKQCSGFLDACVCKCVQVSMHFCMYAFMHAYLRAHACALFGVCMRACIGGPACLHMCMCCLRAAGRAAGRGKGLGGRGQNSISFVRTFVAPDPVKFVCFYVEVTWKFSGQGGACIKHFSNNDVPSTTIYPFIYILRMT